MLTQLSASSNAVRTSPHSTHSKSSWRPLRCNRCKGRNLSTLAGAGEWGVPGDIKAGSFRVVITGSTKGLGLALARCFLEKGDRVVVTSRDEARVDLAVNALRIEHGDRVFGTTSDVSDAHSVAALSKFAFDELGGVDIWINNAGANGYTYESLADSEPDTLREIVLTNSLGTLLCCREATKLMSTQSSGGHIFNLLGAGSDGGLTQKYAAYGHTKAGMVQLTKTLAEELKGTSVGVHALSPGMVFTELISSGRYAFGSQGRFFVNTLAENPETPALTLVESVRDFMFDPDSSSAELFGVPVPRALRGVMGASSQTFEVLTADVVVRKLFRRLILGEGKDRFYPEVDDS